MDPLRLRSLNDRPRRGAARYVLYWMSAARRTRHNFGLQRAVELANELERPLLVFEALRAGYRWASARHHAFAIDGMRDNAARCAAAGVAYSAWIEPRAGAGKGLFAALAADACAVVADDWPCFFLPRALAAAARQSPVAFEAVDSCGLLPLRAAPGAFARAYDLRRYLQRELAPHLARAPLAEPLDQLRARGQAELAPAVLRRFELRGARELADARGAPAVEGLDLGVAAVARPGGPSEGARVLAAFLARNLDRYHEERSHVDAPAASGLSPYLHYGHVGAHEVFAALAARESWSPAALGASTAGKKEGWWGMSAGAESFLDELVTWRELGFNAFVHHPDSDRYESLPAWALATLERHARDRRPHVYTHAELERASTHDELWNCAQRELVRSGGMHNYLRMLWGKKVLEWSRHPREAFATLVELNNKYALDGRDPNSYSGIAWCFGRYDRPWAPERPIFGVIRYMSSANTARKFRVRDYMARHAADAGEAQSGALPFA
ncbi:MAG: deoxyribodipyrimidine photolyase [Planctomycetota bacterium]|nr:MAG: deoxyribodipyrimidine photolyase [Planctomycetota bacterium]